MAITLEQAQAQLDAALAARLRTLRTERYRMGTVELQRSMLASVDASIDRWEKRVQEIESAASRGARIRRRGIIPRDL